ncbi:MAG: uroporphyrinogen decarboxylase [Candidatus Tokpelaia sp. JSC161]|jgi:uroporphyrinogen decarboxylase|nr:MAG: uroporphyrinogen decarboxylase [Candidatus Tokpelaia sp. JSC161]
MKKIIKVINGENFSIPPIWMMRQAGRYLPEYRKIRARAESFLKLCQTPELAAEITLQPIHRFHLDAAIIFSDILIIPYVLGRDLRFEEKRGPIMPPITMKEIIKLDTKHAMERLSFSFETIEKVKSKIDDQTAIIGFCGAPWIVASYMIAGKSPFDQGPARLFSYFHPDLMQIFLENLADISADYLIQQVNSGADILQIFDNCSGVDQRSFEKLCLQPVRRMINKIKKIHPRIPIIGFPRGAGLFYKNYGEKTGVTVLGLDWTIPLSFAKKLQNKIIIQGNLDPLRLVAGGDALYKGIHAILRTLKKKPFIFNLGHGITPNTPIKHVEQMINCIRGK